MGTRVINHLATLLPRATRTQVINHLATNIYTATFVDLPYGLFGSSSTLTHAGKPDANALSSAGRISSGRSTSSP